MTKDAIEVKRQEVKNLKDQLQDLFRLYLDTDIAGDNEDRRQKLVAVGKIEKILDNS